jgi:putative SOS response-associated peptidase YedK
MTKKRNDYKVYDYRSSAYPELAQWQIRIGESDRLAVVVSTFRDYDKAVETARQLNIDPWFLDRGNTRADRASKI